MVWNQGNSADKKGRTLQQKRRSSDLCDSRPVRESRTEKICLSQGGILCVLSWAEWQRISVVWTFSHRKSQGRSSWVLCVIHWLCVGKHLDSCCTESWRCFHNFVSVGDVVWTVYFLVLINARPKSARLMNNPTWRRSFSVVKSPLNALVHCLRFALSVACVYCGRAQECIDELAE